MADHDKPTPEREWLKGLDWYLSRMAGMPDLGSAIVPLGDLRRLRAAHKETRAEVERLQASYRATMSECAESVETAQGERDEALAEVERLKREPFRVSSCNVCGTTIFPGDDCPGCQRNRAQRDAVALANVVSVDRCSSKLLARIDSYRKAQPKPGVEA